MGRERERERKLTGRNVEKAIVALVKFQEGHTLDPYHEGLIKE